MLIVKQKVEPVVSYEGKRFDVSNQRTPRNGCNEEGSNSSKNIRVTILDIKTNEVYVVNLNSVVILEAVYWYVV